MKTAIAKTLLSGRRVLGTRTETTLCWRPVMFSAASALESARHETQDHLCGVEV